MTDKDRMRECGLVPHGTREEATKAQRENEERVRLARKRPKRK